MFVSIATLPLYLAHFDKRIYICNKTFFYILTECCSNILRVIYLYIDGNVSKPRISKMRNVQETQKTVSKQTDN